MKDTRARSIVKGISWRVLGTLDTFLLAFILFGNITSAAKIAGTEVITKIVLYYFHERIWNRIQWGRKGKKVIHVRSVTKGISWRVLGTLDTMIISWIYTGAILGAVQLGAAETGTKIILYYLHERVWSLIKWGRLFEDETTPPENQGQQKTIKKSQEQVLIQKNDQGTGKND